MYKDAFRRPLHSSILASILWAQSPPLWGVLPNETYITIEYLCLASKLMATLQYRYPNNICLYETDNLKYVNIR